MSDPVRILGATFPRREDLCQDHPCNFKPVYYAMFAESVRGALVAAGISVSDPEEKEHGLVIRFAMSDGSAVSALVDYADQVHVDGLVEHAMKEDHRRLDIVFKMKPCDRFSKEYEEFTERTGLPILPWGYVIAPTHSGDPVECVQDREWFFANVLHLRAEHRKVIESGCGSPPLMTRGSFHALHHCPERRRFFDGRLFQGEKTEVAFRQHMLDVARSGAILNLCGPDNTIDRKVVEACAMGVPIISNDGLRDLRLPYGCRFSHGENVWFVNSAEEAISAANSFGRQTRDRLSAGGIALYERCFRPESVGRHMIERVIESAASRVQ